MAVETFKVVNAGNLALKYQLSLNKLVAKDTDYNTVKWGTATEEYDLTDVIKVAVTDSRPADRTAAQALNYVSWDAFVNGAAKVGNLAPGADESFSVVLYWAPNANDDHYNLKNGEYDATSNKEGYTLSSDSELFINATVTLNATQYTSESDSFDNQYDAYADGVHSFAISTPVPVSTTGNTNVSAQNAAGQDVATLAVPQAVAAATGATTLSLQTGAATETMTSDTVEITGALDLVNENGEKVDLNSNTTPIPATYFVGKNLGAGAKITLTLNHSDTDSTTFKTAAAGGAPGEMTYDTNTGFVSFSSAKFCPVEVEFAKPEAKVGDTFYATLREALDVAESGATVELLRDADLENEYGLTRSVTINGNSHKVRASKAVAGYSASREGRVFDISDVSNIDVKFSNIEIVGEPTAVRGISAYKSKNVKLVLDHCSIWANYYAINIASENTGFVLEASNSTCSTGWCAVQSWSSGAKFTFENCVLSGMNDKTYNSDGWNNFATVVLNESATGNEWSFKDCTIKAKQTTGNKQWLFLFGQNGNASVSTDNCKFYLDDKLLTGDFMDMYVAKGAAFSATAAIQGLTFNMDGVQVYPAAT